MQETSLSSPAHRLKYLLEKDDERQRRSNIRNSVQREVNYDTPSPPVLIPLFENQSSVEKQLQKQVAFYEEALERLKGQSDEIACENAMLYERVRQSIELDYISSTSDDKRPEEDVQVVQEKPSKGKQKERLLRTKTEFEITKAPNEDEKEVNSSYIESELSQQTEELVKKNVLRDNLSVVEDINDSLFGKHGKSLKMKKEKDLKRNSLEKSVNMESIQSQKDFKGHQLLREELEKMQGLHETKTNHLKSLLETSRKQNEKQREEIKILKAERRSFKASPNKEENLCTKCSSLHGKNPTPAENKIIDRLTRERNELIDGIKKQQNLVKEGNKRELEAYNQVKKSCELVEQVQIEKQEAVVQTVQFQKEINKLKASYQKLQREFSEHNRLFNQQHKDAMQKMIEELNKKVDEQSNTISVLQVQGEKHTREKVDLKKEAEQLRVHIATQKAETASLMEDARKDVMQALKAKALAEQEINKCHSESQRREKQKQLAVDQLVIEIQDVKRRLNTTEEALQRSQDEVLKLTQGLNMCSQKLQHAKHENTTLKQSFEDEKKRLLCESDKREQDIALRLQESEMRFNSNRDELTRLLESQTVIVTKYQKEYKLLTQGIETERQNNHKVLSDLQKQCRELEKKVLNTSNIHKEKERFIEKLKKQLNNCQVENDDYKEQLVLHMNKQNTILRDRHLLIKEIELLRSQLPTNIRK